MEARPARPRSAPPRQHGRRSYRAWHRPQGACRRRRVDRHHHCQRPTYLRDLRRPRRVRAGTDRRAYPRRSGIGAGAGSAWRASVQDDPRQLAACPSGYWQNQKPRSPSCAPNSASPARRFIGMSRRRARLGRTARSCWQGSWRDDPEKTPIRTASLALAVIRRRRAGGDARNPHSCRHGQRTIEAGCASTTLHRFAPQQL